MAVNAAAKADKSQARFYDALTDLFVGAKVDGESGFINLMRIKSRYYTDGVFQRLQKDIDLPETLSNLTGKRIRRTQIVRSRVRFSGLHYLTVSRHTERENSKMKDLTPCSRQP